MTNHKTNFTARFTKLEVSSKVPISITIFPLNIAHKANEILSGTTTSGTARDSGDDVILQTAEKVVNTA
jgi:hypothetical protein